MTTTSTTIMIRKIYAHTLRSIVLVVSMSSISKEVELVGVILFCCLSSVLVVTAQSVQCSKECLSDTPRLQLALKPGINQAVCLDFDLHRPAGENFTTLLNRSECSTFGGFAMNSNRSITCKILANLNKNRTNCTVQGVVIECRITRPQSVELDEQAPVDGDQDNSSQRDSRSNHQHEASQDFEEFNLLALQLNSTLPDFSSYLYCNVFIDVRWMMIGEQAIVVTVFFANTFQVYLISLLIMIWS